MTVQSLLDAAIDRWSDASAVRDTSGSWHVDAYGLTASLPGFLSRPAPNEVVLDGDAVVSMSRLRIDRIPIAKGLS